MNFLAVVRATRGLCAIFALCAFGAQAQPFPNKPVRLEVAFAPGGPADIIARLINQKLSEALGQPVLVENRPGAGGAVAARQLATSGSDGHTVLITTTAFAVTPSLSRPAGFDIEKDFAPVSLIATQPSVLVAYPGLNLNTLAEVMAAAKGGKLNFGTAGAGTTPHLAGEYLFRVLGKVDVTHVPYNGGGPALQAVVGGNVELVNVALSPAIPLIKGGKLRAIAVTSPKRAAALPEVPAVAETYPGFEDYTWVAALMPAATPAATVNRLSEEIDKLLKTPEMRERLAAIAFEPVGGTPAQFARSLKADATRLSRFVRETGLKIE
ncbi:MAG TPA: tripartite tricarboxylate transporter substrate binding protein [Burkholderiales bacterium]|nr:tripartite tricarboxylate transporter substrate binding protein [Burkholderiales bacterium]